MKSDSPGGQSISRRLSFSLVFIVFMVVAVILAVTFAVHSVNLKSALDEKAEDYVSRLADILEVPLWNYDESHVRQIGSIFAENDLIHSLRVHDDQGRTLFEVRKIEDRAPKIAKSNEIFFEGKAIGRVLLEVTQARYLVHLKLLLIGTLCTLLAALIVMALGTNLLLATFLRRPLASLEQGMDRVAAGDFSHSLDQPYRELAGISRRYGEMVEQVRRREEKLQRINEELLAEIHERVEYQRALEASEERFRTAVQTLMEGFAIVRPVHDREGRIVDFTYVYINDAGCRINGIQRDMHLSSTLLGIFPHLESMGMVDDYARVIESGTPLHKEYLFFQEAAEGESDRLRRSIEVRSVRFGDGLSVVWNDTTERNVSAQALRMTQFAVDRTRDAAYWMSREGKLFYVNEAACALLGYSREELLRMTVHDIMPEHPEEVWPAHWEELRRRGSFVFESVNRRKDGTVFPVEISVNLLVFEGREVNCAFARDITERRQAHDVLKRANLVLENSPVMLFRWRAAPEWPVELVSDNIRQMGYQPEELLSGSIPYASLVHDGDLARVADEVKDFTERGVDRFEQVYRVVCKDGRTRWVEDRTFVERNEAGQVTHYQGIVMDITERREAEEALRESETRFRALFENMPSGLALHKVMLDGGLNPVDYRILDVNPAYEKHAGLPAQKVRGALGSQAYGTGVAPYLKEYAEVATDGIPLVFETYFEPLQKHFQVTVFSPQRGLFATVFEDISDRKRNEEELRQKNEEMERFVYTISHDLKSPLVTIQTFLRYLEKDMQVQDQERVRKDMDYIANAATRMNRLLEELLELSRIGRKVNPPREMLLQDVVGEAVNLVAGRLTERGVRVEVASEPVVLYGDRTRMVEVFQNLIDNAAKFTGDQDSPTIWVGAEDVDGEMVLYVKDNGMGVDPRYRGKLFGLFEKLDPGSEGTGVGLALVKRIIEIHSGRIWVESDGPGLGTVFRFALPGTRRGEAE